VDQLIRAAAAHLQEITATIAALSLAIILGIFALFLRPKLKDIEDLRTFKTTLDTLDLPKKLPELHTFKTTVETLDLPRTVGDFQTFKTTVETLELAKNLAELQRLTTSVAVLEKAEEQRNTNVKEAIAGIKVLIDDLTTKIRDHYDRKTKQELMELRITALETSATLAKLQSVEKAQEAEEKLTQARQSLRDFLKASPAA
jgi:hypothetical protein